MKATTTFLRGARAITGRIIRCVQAVVVVVLLAVIYIVGVGVTAAAMRLCRAFRCASDPPLSSTLWREAEGYRIAVGDAVKQS